MRMIKKDTSSKDIIAKDTQRHKTIHRYFGGNNDV